MYSFLCLGVEMKWFEFYFCYFKDAILVARNQEAMEAARRKMQEDLDAKAVLFKEKQKQVKYFYTDVVQIYFIRNFKN